MLCGSHLPAKSDQGLLHSVATFNPEQSLLAAFSLPPSSKSSPDHRISPFRCLLTDSPPWCAGSSQCACKANLFSRCFPGIFGGLPMLLITVVLLPYFMYQKHRTYRSSFSPKTKKGFRDSLKECNSIQHRSRDPGTITAGD